MKKLKEVLKELKGKINNIKPESVYKMSQQHKNIQGMDKTPETYEAKGYPVYSM